MRRGVVVALLWLVQGTGAVAEPLNLSPIQSAQWNADKARHLASRAGFGASAEELAALVRLGPKAAVNAFLTSRPPE